MKDSTVLAVMAVALFIAGAWLVITNAGWTTFIGIYVLLWSNNIERLLRPTVVKLENKE